MRKKIITQKINQKLKKAESSNYVHKLPIDASEDVAVTGRSIFNQLARAHVYLALLETTTEAA